MSLQILPDNLNKLIYARIFRGAKQTTSFQ
jgi:hypothetical protein